MHSRKQLFALSLPIFAELMLRNLAGTVNVFLIGRVSDEAVASVGVANQVMNIILIAFSIVSSGAGVLVNQNLGAGQREEASDIGSSAISAACLLGGIISVGFLLFAGPIASLFAMEASAVANAALYLRWVGSASFFIAFSTVVSILFRSYGDARTPMVSVFIMNLINLLGNCLVVYFPTLLPLSGVAGIGAVRLLSELGGLLFLLWRFVKKAPRFGFCWKLCMRGRHLLGVLRIGGVSGLEGISYNTAQVVLTGMIASLGSMVVSTRIYVQNITNLVYLLGMAIGQATQILAGQEIGSGNREGAYRLCKRSFWYVLLSNGSISLTILLLSRPIMGLFTTNPQIIDLAVALFAIDLFTQLSRAMNHSFGSGLKGAGYVVVPAIFASSSIWAIAVGLGSVATITLGLGIYGVAITTTLDEFARGLFNCILFLQRRWYKINLVSTEKQQA